MAVRHLVASRGQAGQVLGFLLFLEPSWKTMRNGSYCPQVSFHSELFAFFCQTGLHLLFCSSNCEFYCL